MSSKNLMHSLENDADFQHFASYSGLNEFADDPDNGDARFLALEWASKGFEAGSKTVASAIPPVSAPAAVPAAVPSEPVRPIYDSAAVRFGACEWCDRRANIHPHDGGMICGSCADAEYLSSWKEYAGQLLKLLVASAPAHTEAVAPIRLVGDSRFEGWFSQYSAAGKGDKQRARDAYSAGMNDSTAAVAQDAAKDDWLDDTIRKLFTCSEDHDLSNLQIERGILAEQTALLSAPHPRASDAQPVYQARARGVEVAWADVNHNGFLVALAMRSMEARILYTAPTLPAQGLQALRDVIRCLRETGVYRDEEGESTNALQDIVAGYSTDPAASDAQQPPMPPAMKPDGSFTNDDVVRSVEEAASWRRVAEDARRTAEYWKAEHMCGNKEINRLRAMLAAAPAAPLVAQQEPNAYLAALRELVACKDLKEQAEAIEFAGPNSTHGDDWQGERNRLRDEYIKRQPIAWQVARELVTAPRAADSATDVPTDKELSLWLRFDGSWSALRELFDPAMLAAMRADPAYGWDKIKVATAAPADQAGERETLSEDALTQLYHRAQVQSRPHWIENARIILRTAPAGEAQNFACFLIDKCEGETITEESIQRWFGAMLANQQYASAAPAGEAQPFSVGKVKKLVKQWMAGACSGVTTDGNDRMTQISFSEDGLTFFLNMIAEHTLASAAPAGARKLDAQAVEELWFEVMGHSIASGRMVAQAVEFSERLLAARTDGEAS